ncbi:MAG: HU family DNA-binding protein [Spirochaetota bacterium]
MTKRELIDMVYLKTDIPKKDVTSVVNAFLESVLETVSGGERVDLRGFGTFYLAEKKRRQVFSPIAQKTIDVEAGFNVMFKSSKNTKITTHPGD